MNAKASPSMAKKAIATPMAMPALAPTGRPLFPESVAMTEEVGEAVSDAATAVVAEPVVVVAEDGVDDDEEGVNVIEVVEDEKEEDEGEEVAE
jgi:hypothetical protein